MRRWPSIYKYPNAHSNGYAYAHANGYADSHANRAAGGDLIGMTCMPEAKLAREAELCYALLALPTDYDFLLQCDYEGCTACEDVQYMNEAVK